MQLKCLPSISKHCPKSLVHTCQQQACTADQYYTTSLSMAWHVFITLIQMEKEMSLSVSGTCILMFQIFIIATCKNCKNLFCPIQCWQKAQCIMCQSKVFCQYSTGMGVAIRVKTKVLSLFKTLTIDANGPAISLQACSAKVTTSV